MGGGGALNLPKRGSAWHTCWGKKPTKFHFGRTTFQSGLWEWGVWVFGRGYQARELVDSDTARGITSKRGGTPEAANQPADHEPRDFVQPNERERKSEVQGQFVRMRVGGRHHQDRGDQHSSGGTTQRDWAKRRPSAGRNKRLANSSLIRKKITGRGLTEIMNIFQCKDVKGL